MTFLAPAVRFLLDYHRRPRTNLRLLLTRFLEKYRGRDKQALTRTIYGVTRKEIVLEHVIGLFLKKKDRPPPLPTLILLKISVFLLLFSESYPEYAVVNEAVNAAARKEKAFVNAVLRQMLRRRAEVKERLAASTDPALKYSLAPLLLAALQRIGAAADSDLEYLDREPLFHLRFHSGRMTMEQAQLALEACAIPCRALPRLGCFETATVGRFLDQAGHLDEFYLQNSGSQAVALVAASRAGKKVCDVAAAPGGKTLTLACLRPDLKILASDIHPLRLRLLEQNVRRLRLGNVSSFAADVLRYPAIGRPPDLLILDAPCTSCGTLRKNPDLKSRIDRRRVLENARQQRLMLDSLAARFSGSRLLYSVCSFLPEESEEVVEKIAAGRKLRPADLKPMLQKLGFRVRQGEFGFYLLPSELNNDLFYISLLEPIEPGNRSRRTAHGVRPEKAPNSNFQNQR
ncbi:MAG: hypothetical protein JXO51_03285 [Candidatus Aminicenantes bacterium]|nr:hypothetical protein [Candidatus Aminicenantes bacterium]